MGKRYGFRAILLFFVLMCGQFVYAEEFYFEIYFDSYKPYYYRFWERTGRIEQKVYEVGFKLLNENKFPKRVRFVVDESNGSKQVINASTDYRNGTITIWKGLLFYIENDDELAAVLGHELTHVEQFSRGFWPWKELNVYAPILRV